MDKYFFQKGRLLFLKKRSKKLLHVAASCRRRFQYPPSGSFLVSV
jgi:hypothetical protein